MNVSETRELKVSLLVFHERRCNFVCSSNSGSQIIGDCTLLCFSFAEQLVLCMKAEVFLSAALHTAKENVNSGQLLPSSTVKQGEHADSSFWDSISILNVCKMRLLVALNAKWTLACCVSWLQWSESWMICTRVVWHSVTPSAGGCRPSCSTSRSWWTASVGWRRKSCCTATLCTWWVDGPPQSSCSVAHHRPLMSIADVFRCRLQRWMKCFTVVQLRCSVTTKHCCWWRVCPESWQSRRTSTV